MTSVTEYPSETPRRDTSWTFIGMGFLFGFPVGIGCLIYLSGAPAWDAMFYGASFVIIPLGLLMTLARMNWRRMVRKLGRPLESGERVEVTWGPLNGKCGTVESAGQGGPMTLFVRLDDSVADELVVFSWDHLRRLE